MLRILYSLRYDSATVVKKDVMLQASSGQRVYCLQTLADTRTAKSKYFETQADLKFLSKIPKTGKKKF